MGRTTLTVDDSIAERFERYRHDNHHNTSEVLETMMNVLPAYDDLECDVCGNGAMMDAPLDENFGILEFFEQEANGQTFFETFFFCSLDCLDERTEMRNLYTPDEPDAVIIGGCQEPRIRLESGATFMRDGDATFVSLDIPVALKGERRHGDPVDYEGEPIYVENRDRIIQTGIVADLLHEDWCTNINIERDAGMANFFHPDDETRESSREKFSLNYTPDCPECGTTVYTHEGGDDTLECHDCGAEFDRPDPPEERVAKFYADDGGYRGIMEV